jgi:hypothetical protein
MKLISDNAWDVAKGVWIGSGRAKNDIDRTFSLLSSVIAMGAVFPLAVVQGVFLHWMLGAHALGLGIAIIDIGCAAVLALGIFVAVTGFISRWWGAVLIFLGVGGMVESWIVSLLVWLFSPLPH